MSMWELIACWDGWLKANGGEQEPDAPSYEEHLAMVGRAVSS